MIATQLSPFIVSSTLPCVPESLRLPDKLQDDEYDSYKQLFHIDYIHRSLEQNINFTLQTVIDINNEAYVNTILYIPKDKHVEQMIDEFRQKKITNDVSFVMTKLLEVCSLYSKELHSLSEKFSLERITNNNNPHELMYYTTMYNITHMLIMFINSVNDEYHKVFPTKDRRLIFKLYCLFLTVYLTPA